MLHLQFTEAPRFVRNASKVLSEDEITKLYVYINQNPNIGVVIRNSEGIRKLRWASSGRGKRGGSRVIYYFAAANERVLLLEIYAKSKKSDLTFAEIAELNVQLALWLKSL